MKTQKEQDMEKIEWMRDIIHRGWNRVKPEDIAVTVTEKYGLIGTFFISKNKEEFVKLIAAHSDERGGKPPLSKSINLIPIIEENIVRSNLLDNYQEGDELHYHEYCLGFLAAGGGYKLVRNGEDIGYMSVWRS